MSPILDILPARLAEPIDWNGRQVQTLSEVYRAISAIDDSDSARIFVALAHVADPENANTMIGYLLGYHAHPRQRLELFDVDHPVYGRERLTDVELLFAGMMSEEQQRFVRVVLDAGDGLTWRCEQCGLKTRSSEQAGWHSDTEKHSLALAPFDEADMLRHD